MMPDHTSLQDPNPTSRARALPWWTLFVGLLAFVYATGILFSADGRQPGIDSHYHYLMAQEIAQGDFAPDMRDDLPLTVYDTWNVDHYWGFHVLLSPFTLGDNAEAGMKIATILMFCLILLSLFHYLRSRGVPFPWAWAFVPLLLTSMDWRYLHLRGAQLLVPLMLFFMAVAFFEGRDRRRRLLLFFIPAVGMLSYQGAIVLFTAHVAGLAGLYLLAPAGFRRERVWEPAISLSGLAAGLTINPYMNASGQTWEFAGYHLFTMGVDRDQLYGRIAEFHGFPPEWFLQHPEWLLMTLLVVGGGLWLIRKRLRKEEVLPEQAITAGLAFLGLCMAAMAARATEYAVILGVVFLASLAPRDLAKGTLTKLSWVLPVVVVLGLWLHSGHPINALNSRSTLHTRTYEGARPLLDSNGARPVLNLVEADYNLLKWEYPRVSCVQGLSRYFLIGNRQVYEDVQMLKSPETSDQDRFRALDRFGALGVKLVANHVSRINGQRTAFDSFARRYRHALEPVFASRGLPLDARNARILRLNTRAVRACAEEGLKSVACVPPQGSRGGSK